MNKAEKFVTMEKARWEKWHEEFPLVYCDKVKWYVGSMVAEKFAGKIIPPEYIKALDTIC